MPLAVGFDRAARIKEEMMRHLISRRDALKGATSLALTTPLLSLVGCQELSAGPDLTVIDGETMGTTYSVKVADAPKSLSRESMAVEISRLLEAVNQQMSTYRTDSELSRFNQASAGTWVDVSPDTATVIAEAGRLSELTAGAFDTTVGPLVDLWGFGPGDSSKSVPSETRIASVRDKIGYRNVHLRSSAPAVSKDRSDIRVDLSGIAKGFGVDKIAEYLEQAGAKRFLVEVGGDMRSSGLNANGKAWQIGIEKPLTGRGQLQQIVPLSSQAMATSGDYRIFFEREGTRYSHIVNPQTGRPVTHELASVTVVAETAMQADALSTALFVLGPDAGLELAKMQNTAAFFIAKDGGDLKTFSSPAFADVLKA